VSLMALLADANAGSAPVLVVEFQNVALSPIWQQGSEWPRPTICYLEADMDAGAISKTTVTAIADKAGAIEDSGKCVRAIVLSPPTEAR
jgi:hypothetical protein